MSVNYVALGKRIGYFRMQCGNITQEDSRVRLQLMRAVIFFLFLCFLFRKNVKFQG